MLHAHTYTRTKAHTNMRFKLPVYLKHIKVFMTKNAIPLDISLFWYQSSAFIQVTKGSERLDSLSFIESIAQ